MKKVLIRLHTRIETMTDAIIQELNAENYNFLICDAEDLPTFEKLSSEIVYCITPYLTFELQNDTEIKVIRDIYQAGNFLRKRKTRPK